jgi:hypothetical protein
MRLFDVIYAISVSFTTQKKRKKTCKDLIAPYGFSPPLKLKKLKLKKTMRRESFIIFLSKI